MNMTDTEINTVDRLGKYIQEGNISNEALVQIIELCGSFLNLQSISDYAKSNKLSYNGAKNYRTNITLFNTKFIIENE